MNLVNSLVFVGTLFCTYSLARYEYTFETGTEGFWPISSNITIERSTPGYGGSNGCLHVFGASPEGKWHYTFNQINVTAGQKYRVLGMLKINELLDNCPVPSLKVEFGGSTVITPQYSVSKMGEWQMLETEFAVPNGKTSAWVGIDKGDSDELVKHIECWLDNFIITEINEYNPWFMTKLYEIPTTLESKRGVHPRLFYTTSQINYLKSTLQSSTYYFWKYMFEVANTAAISGAPDWYYGDSDGEQLWQRDVGNYMPFLALSYLLTGNTTFLNSAKEWALKSCSYPTWGIGTINGTDLATGHQLFGLAIVYDWLYNSLDSSSRTTIRNTLLERGEYVARKAVYGDAWWTTTFLHNHQWINLNGIGAAALALFDDSSEKVQNQTRYWLTLVTSLFKKSRDCLGPDGASVEGVGYWGYGTEFLLKWYEMSKTLLGENLWSSNSWWENTASYRIYMSIPRSYWRGGYTVVDLGDANRGNWDGNSEQMHCFAREFTDCVSQWFGRELAGRFNDDTATWMSGAFFNPDLASKSPLEAGLPTIKHFDDFGIVSMRSGWSGSDTMVVAKCGPPLGHHAIETDELKVLNLDLGGAHQHPDTGHFVLFGAGEWLIIDDGYADGSKWTVQHNTLAVKKSGKYVGQCGEGQRWLQAKECYQVAKGLANIPLVKTSPDFDYVKMDATNAYGLLSAPTITKFVRHLVYLKKVNALFIVDDITSDTSAELNLLLHTEFLPAISTSSNVIFANGTSSKLRIHELTPSGVAVTAGKMDLSTQLEQNTVLLTKTTASWKNAIAITWSDVSAYPSVVTFTETGSKWTFALGNNSLVFDWTTLQFDVDGTILVDSSETTCTPQTCVSLGFECDSAQDGCGNSLNCGSCSSLSPSKTCVNGKCKDKSVSSSDNNNVNHSNKVSINSIAIVVIIITSLLF